VQCTKANSPLHRRLRLQIALHDAATFATTIGLNAKTFPPGALQHLKELFIAGWGAYPLTGTKEQVVEGLQTMSATGLDGALLSWPRFEDGMREFKDVTYPLLVQAGLR
jgi:alkanesulfonate monooxygenase SsuD/methylene tetrahydromethanopterin reductase-like flavin-dependent oxidoreductase (luciferase family)